MLIYWNIQMYDEIKYEMNWSNFIIWKYIRIENTYSLDNIESKKPQVSDNIQVYLITQ